MSIEYDVFFLVCEYLTCKEINNFRQTNKTLYSYKLPKKLCLSNWDTYNIKMLMHEHYHGTHLLCEEDLLKTRTNLPNSVLIYFASIDEKIDYHDAGVPTLDDICNVPCDEKHKKEISELFTNVVQYGFLVRWATKGKYISEHIYCLIKLYEKYFENRNVEYYHSFILLDSVIHLLPDHVIEYVLSISSNTNITGSRGLSAKFWTFAVAHHKNGFGKMCHIKLDGDIESTKKLCDLCSPVIWHNTLSFSTEKTTVNEKVLYKCIKLLTDTYPKFIFTSQLLNFIIYCDYFDAFETHYLLSHGRFAQRIDHYYDIITVTNDGIDFAKINWKKLEFWLVNGNLTATELIRTLFQNASYDKIFELLRRKVITRENICHQTLLYKMYPTNAKFVDIILSCGKNRAEIQKIFDHVSSKKLAKLIYGRLLVVGRQYITDKLQYLASGK